MSKIFLELYNAADAAGKDAASKHISRPMVVAVAKNILGSEIVPGTQEVIADGVCGFAWINIKPGTSSFARWLKKEGYAYSDDYYGGVTVWVREYNQSMELKEAYAYAFARILRIGGIKAYADSRMD